MTTTTPAPPATDALTDPADALTDPAAPSLTAVTNENKVEVHLSLPSAFCCETWDEWEKEWIQAYGTIVHTLHRIYPNLQLGGNVGSCKSFPQHLVPPTKKKTSSLNSKEALTLLGSAREKTSPGL
eukprot:Blabericola_migrator_1__1078@NODE_1275_length_4917_cov_13_485155_g860_i0_p2_GENE_NODE_1275_length_4917_cov_13_485155_g860_i0NODE_1275_length_4917_cov_13_485155_g860_i0_p2_ORF_typecomplete_len126_score16_46_NODE_1275_length_4917_cov_13_485155_g860_i018612238